MEQISCRTVQDGMPGGGLRLDLTEGGCNLSHDDGTRFGDVQY